MSDRVRSETILAIPTELDGVTYRSRSEARWAHFFDVMEIPFEYEPEGFVLQDGSRYLPDFYLPTVNFWAECKPTYLTEKEERKCRLLSSGTGWPCLWLIGIPDFRAYLGATWDCGNYTVCEYSLDVWENRKAYEYEHRLWAQPGYSQRLDLLQFSDMYKHAVWAAKNYKFEGY